MAGAYLVTLDRTKGGATLKDGVDAVVVWAEDATTAKQIAQAQQVGSAASDAAWSAATATALAATADFEGWRFRLRIADAPTAAVDVTVTGAASADMDAIAALMVTALNATADISGAAYSTPNLTIASGGGGDDLGDLEVEAWMYPPTGSADFPAETEVSFTQLLGAITDGGSSTDALAIALDTSAPVPTLLARLKQ